MPEPPAPAARIMVPVGGNGVDAETVRIACRMAKRNDGRLYAVHVIEVNRSLPLGTILEEDVQRGETVLDEVEEIARQAGIDIETEMVQARETGPAVVGEAEQWGADLILMGLPYKRRFGEFNMGRTVPFVLKNAACRVMLFRERLEPD